MRKPEKIIVFLDIETTGLDPKKGLVLEIAARAFARDTFEELSEPFKVVE